MPEVQLPTPKQLRRRSRWADGIPVDQILAFIRQNATPAGSIVGRFSNVAPSEGWFLCDGRALSETEWPTLFAAIGTEFGAGPGTFNLPDLTDRYLVGAGTLAGSATGGSNTLNLTQGQMPNHTHLFTGAPHAHTVTDAGHIHGVTDPGHIHTVTDPLHTHGAAVTATGGGVAPGAGENVAGGGNTAASGTGISINSAQTGVSINTTTTGLTVDDQTAGGTNAPAGNNDPIDNRPASIGVFWFIKT